MAKKDEKNDGDSKGSEKPLRDRSQDEMFSGPVDSDTFDEVLRKPGLTRSEGATTLEEMLPDILPEHVNLEGYEVPSELEINEDEARAALEDLRDSGSLKSAEDALEALNLLEHQPDEVPDASEYEGDPVPLEKLVSEAGAEGLGADAIQVEVTVDGETETMPLSEALSGYSRTADYSRKTAEIAERRKELDGALQETQARLEVLGQAAQAMAPEQRQQLTAAYQRTQAERQALQAHILETEVLPQESQALREKLEIESDDDLQAARELVAEAAVEHYGYQPEELGNVYDHRLLHLAHDAAKYRQLMAQQSEAETKARENRRSSATLKGGNRNTRHKSNESYEKARKRARRTGRADDAARALIEGGLLD